MNLRAYLKSMGGWKWINLLLVVVIPIAAYVLSWKPLFDPDCFGSTILGPQKLGARTVVVGIAGPLPPQAGDPVTIRVRFCPGCFETILHAELAFGSESKPGPNGRILQGDPNRLEAVLTAPASSSHTHLWLSVEDSAGEQHQISWPVMFGRDPINP